MDTLIILKADDFKVKVSRQLMVEKSEYFSAALTSGMLEATSGQFIFSNMSAGQLSLFADCAKLRFSTWPSSTGAANTSGDVAHTLKEFSLKKCLEKNPSKSNPSGDELHVQLKSVVELTAVADYLQINCLTALCLNRLTELIDQLWTRKAYINEPVVAGSSNTVCAPSIMDAARSLLTHCLDVSQLSDKRCFDLLLEHILQHPADVLSRPCDNHDTSVLMRLGHLVSFILSSDRLCVPDEESVLNTVLYWVTSLADSRIDCSDSSNAWEAFVESVRPGLLTPEARQRFFAFWSAHFPSIRFLGTFTVDSMLQLFENLHCGGTFASVRADMTADCLTLYRPRASVPCLLSLLPTASRDSFEVWMFNLLSGGHHKFASSPDFFALLSGCNSNMDFIRRMFLCHSSIASTVVILCYNVAIGCLSGFLWSLANFEAQWLPSLALPALRTGYSNATNTTTSLYGNPLGIATLPTGLYVYCTTVSGGRVQLHAFRLDLEAKRWQEFAPASLAAVPTDGLVLFTPVEQVSCLAATDWLYANLEITHRLKGREARVRRHNLHHTSQLRSLFLRFTPVLEGRKLHVQTLPPAPFLVRIYRLLTVRSSETAGDFLFAFGTCTRDRSASQVCFDVASGQWRQWSPGRSSARADSKSREQLIASLDPELLGFRGLACVTHLRLARDFEPLDGDALPPPPDFRVFHHPADQLVLIGRPGYRFDYDREVEVSPGIWFHQPDVGFPGPDETAPHGEPQLAFPLPTSLLQRLYDFPSPALVALVNWDYAVAGEDRRERGPFVFRSVAGGSPVPGDNAKKKQSVDGGASLSSPVTASLLSCIGYSACDSD